MFQRLHEHKNYNPKSKVCRAALLYFTDSNRRVTGGAMQLSFSYLTVDYYPFHKAGMNMLCITCACNYVAKLLITTARTTKEVYL